MAIDTARSSTKWPALYLSLTLHFISAHRRPRLRPGIRNRSPVISWSQLEAISYGQSDSVSNTAQVFTRERERWRRRRDLHSSTWLASWWSLVINVSVRQYSLIMSFLVICSAFCYHTLNLPLITVTLVTSYFDRVSFKCTLISQSSAKWRWTRRRRRSHRSFFRPQFHSWWPVNILINNNL